MMKLSLACLAAGTAIAAASVPGSVRGVQTARGFVKGTDPNADFCALVSGDLPSICTCADDAGGGKISCQVSLFGQTVEFNADMEVCATPGSIDLEVVDQALGVDWSESYSLDENGTVPVRVCARACS